MEDWQRLIAAFFFYILNITLLQGTLKTTLTILGFSTEWYHVVGLALLLTLAFLRFISPEWGLPDLLALGTMAGVYLIAIYNNPTQVVAELLKSVVGFATAGILMGLASRR
ncbi:MAG: hypothetical protein DRN90_00580 [Thermoproteota archaeon]|nr:MAG: hypothetical protein DRN90_00580 [Candidatus Korarchaeota archaeon]